VAPQKKKSLRARAHVYTYRVVKEDIYLNLSSTGENKMTEPIKRSLGMQAVYDSLFPSNTAAIKANVCTSCQKSVKSEELLTEAERREVGISGLCGPCQRRIFSSPEEDDGDGIDYDND
jgi:hypothetical protein